MNSYRYYPRRAFTLIELLIVIAIIAILSAAVVLVLNPIQLLAQARDTERVSDLQTLNNAIILYRADGGSSFGSATTTYVSIPDSSPTCANLGLPTLPSGKGYACVTSANLYNKDGTGWVPINFGTATFGAPLAQLPIDPVNSTSTGQFYTYTPGGSWELTAAMEATRDQGITGIAGKDNGTSWNSYEVGTDLTLTPSQVEEFKRDSSLVAYWPLDGGSGTSANDASGNGNTGTLTNGPTWASSTCKKGDCVSFDGINDYIATPSTTNFNFGSGNFTISFWIYPTTTGHRGSIFGSGSWNFWIDTDYQGTRNVNIWASNNGSSWNLINADPGGNGIGARSLTLNAWNFVVVARNGNNWSTYINNVQDINLNVSGTINPITSTWLIGQQGSFGYNLQALMDDVRVYNRALSSAEIQSIYNATR